MRDPTTLRRRDRRAPAEHCGRQRPHRGGHNL